MRKKSSPVGLSRRLGSLDRSKSLITAIRVGHTPIESQGFIQFGKFESTEKQKCRETGKFKLLEI